MKDMLSVRALKCDPESACPSDLNDFLRTKMMII